MKIKNALVGAGAALALAAPVATVSAPAAAQVRHETTVSQRIDPPTNHVPCRYARSNHCTHSGKFSGTKYSWWYGEKVGRHHKHYITPRRAKIRMQTFFRYYNWTFDGKVDGHPYCWDKLDNMRCGDGYFRYLG